MSSSRTLVWLAGLALLLVGCQPADDPLSGQGGEEQGALDEPPVGVSAGGVPQTLAALFEELDEPAREWQAGAREAEVMAYMEDGRVRRAQVTYVSGGADRFLVIDVTGEETTESIPRLDGLELDVIPTGAVDAIETPEGLADPTELIERAEAALDECGFGDDVTSVLYTTGAPAAWAGESWASEPSWRGILGIEDGGTVRVDPRSGELVGDGCRAAP